MPLGGPDPAFAPLLDDPRTALPASLTAERRRNILSENARQLYGFA